MSLIERIKTGLTLKRAADQFEKDQKEQTMNPNYDWTKSIRAGVTQILTLILSACVTAILGVLGDSETIKAILHNAGMNDAYVGLSLLGVAGLVRVLQNYRKHNATRPSGTNALVLLLVLLPSLSHAQEPSASPSPAAVDINLYGGAMQFAERGHEDKRDFVYRLTVNVPAPGGVTIFGRADYTRTQTVEGVEASGDILDVKTFRSIEAFAGGRKEIAAHLEAMAFSGVTWNRDSEFIPSDPRLWTLAGGLRYTVPGRGYVVAAAGHHGPVGGSAFLGSIVYEINSGASWFGDIAIPLDAARFAARPYTLKMGISARLKGWSF